MEFGERRDKKFFKVSVRFTLDGKKRNASRTIQVAAMTIAEAKQLAEEEAKKNVSFIQGRDTVQIGEVTEIDQDQITTSEMPPSSDDGEPLTKKEIKRRFDRE